MISLVYIPYAPNQMNNQIHAMENLAKQRIYRFLYCIRDSPFWYLFLYQDK
jgi:hypothetical protein